jgi:hypothetical protein
LLQLDPAVVVQLGELEPGELAGLDGTIAGCDRHISGRTLAGHAVVGLRERAPRRKREQERGKEPPDHAAATSAFSFAFFGAPWVAGILSA